MMNMVIERDKLAQVLQERFAAQGIQMNEKVEFVFLEGEMLVRPHSALHAELDEWFAQTARKYDRVLRHLSVSSLTR